MKILITIGILAVCAATAMSARSCAKTPWNQGEVFNIPDDALEAGAVPVLKNDLAPSGAVSQGESPIDNGKSPIAPGVSPTPSETTQPTLPPRPDPQIAKKGLRGVDKNKNGVRDEVERALRDKHGDKLSPKAMNALLGYAKTRQEEMDGRRRGPKAIEETSFRIECLSLTQAHEDLRALGMDPYDKNVRRVLARASTKHLYAAFAIMADVDSLTADTAARKDGMRDADDSAAGMVFRAEDHMDVGKKCGL